MSTFLESIQAQRAGRFFRGAEDCIQTPEELLSFIDDVGFCLFSRIPGVELPDMGGVVSPDADRWGWKDSLPAARQVYYGTVFHPVSEWAARPGFFSLGMLAPIYALAPILQFGGDRALMRRWVKISPEAVAIADALSEAGALSTKDLRASIGLTGKAYENKFKNALLEAQAHYLVTKLGVTSTTRANYGYVWNTFERVFPEAARQAEELTDTDAAALIVGQYVRTAVAVPLPRIAQMLALDLRILQPAAARLLEQGTIQEVEDEGVNYLTDILLIL